jgi:dienelactone hydrolase
MGARLDSGRLAGAALALAGALLVVLGGPATATAYDPALEAKNFAKIQERNAYEVLTPEFQARMQEQNARDAVEFPLLLAGDPERNPLGNICAQRKNECAGDVRFYDWPDAGYGLRVPVLFTARSGAVISGSVWRTRSGPDRRPGIVITTGSVQAPETLYWGIAAALAKRGYVVFTYDVQGQGRSDTFGEGPDANEGVPSQAGQPFYDGTEDALDFFLSTPDQPYAEAMESSCGNANGGVATSHVAKQLRREGERDPFTGLRRAEPHNPFWEHVDSSRIGIAGHSLGAGAVSYIGQRDPRVKAIAAWDNLRTSTGGGSDCPARPATREGVPLSKPAIGFSNDYGLVQTPMTSDPDPQSANGAFESFKQAGVDSMQVNIRGGTHYEYSFIPGNTVNQPLGNATLRGMHLAVWYTAAWMDKYVKCPAVADPEACEQRADAHLLSDRWRDDEPGREVDLNDDGNLFSFYLRSRYDLTMAGGEQAICDDMRSGCETMGADGDPAYPGPYSYIDEANSSDEGAPAAPRLSSTDPSSPSPEPRPSVRGRAPEETTVRIYDNAACSGEPLATGSASQLGAAGIAVPVHRNATTRLRATAEDAGALSACSSAALAYEHDDVAPETRIDSGPQGRTKQRTATFRFSSPDGDAEAFECSLDAAESKLCSSPVRFDRLRQGSHAFRVRAVDRAGNRDSSPARRSFTVVAGPARKCSQTTRGTAGADRLIGGPGSQRILGLGGDDRIDGRAGKDCLRGGAGDDRLRAGAGRDKLAGGRGDDRLIGGPGRDRLSGGPGDDLIRSVGGGRDIVRCGSRRDRVVADRRDRIGSGCTRVRLVRPRG